MHLHCGMDRKSAGHGFLFRFRQDFTGKVPGGSAGKDMNCVRLIRLAFIFSPPAFLL